MLEGKLPNRGVDNWGQGHFGAPRGTKKHKGKDFACEPNTGICAFRTGTVTKIGYPYDDDDDHDGKPDFTYVEVTDYEEYRWRYFYVKPSFTKGDRVLCGDVVGFTQALGKKYPDITEHCHLEIIDKDGNFVNPDEFLFNATKWEGNA